MEWEQSTREKTGLHSRWHTFASTLFAYQVDVKTISKLWSHASIHLFEDIDHDAVAQLMKLLTAFRRKQRWIG